MYSQAALALYPELLKFAEESASAGLEKLAARLAPSLGTRISRAVSGFLPGGAGRTTAREASAMAKNVGNRATATGVSASARAEAADALRAQRANDPRRIAALMGGGSSSAHATYGKLSPEAQQAVSHFRQQRISGKYSPAWGRGGEKVMVHTPMPGQGAKGAAPAAARAGGGLGPGTMALLGGGALAGGYGAYRLGRSQQEAEDKSKRNLAFGAGAAVGLAAPAVLRRAGSSLTNLGMYPYGGG